MICSENLNERVRQLYKYKLPIVSVYSKVKMRSSQYHQQYFIIVSYFYLIGWLVNKCTLLYLKKKAYVTDFC